jgi:predicted TIM-barrel fold metal-dependent hydrolase
MDRYIVVSSDCHAGPLPEKYREYLDPQYRPIFDQALPIQLAAVAKVEKSFLIQEVNEEWRRPIQQQLTGTWEHQERIKVLDSEGITAEIIYVDGITERNSPPFGAGLSLPTKGIDPELQWAGAIAHNRWLAELCAQAPERRLGVAVLPVLWDIERSVKYLRTLVDSGLRNVQIPSMVGDFEHYHHPRYNPFWEACQDLGVIVNLHSGSGPMQDFFGREWPEKESLPGAVGAFNMEVFFWTFRPLTMMLWGGVFERFPRLKVAVAETGTLWLLPPYLRHLDHGWYEAEFSLKLGDYKSHLSMSPTEYFRRNVALGASALSRADIDERYAVGVKQLMWGNDFPHPEGTFPHTWPHYMDRFRGIPEQEVADILGNNAIEFYGLDREKLAKIAERIGPKKSDLAAAA